MLIGESVVLGSVTAVPLSLYALILCITCTFLPCSHFLSLHKMGLILPSQVCVWMQVCVCLCLCVCVCMEVSGQCWVLPSISILRQGLSLGPRVSWPVGWLAESHRFVWHCLPSTPVLGYNIYYTGLLLVCCVLKLVKQALSQLSCLSCSRPIKCEKSLFRTHLWRPCPPRIIFVVFFN